MSFIFNFFRLLSFFIDWFLKACYIRKVTSRLFPEERHQQILSFLEKKGRVSVTELSEVFGISQATIRSDLETLAGQGLLMRTHGGAIASSRSDLELSFDVRRRLHVEEKERIGAAAADMVHDGEAIVLDASTTSLAIAAHLKNRRELTVVTNSLYVANELLDAPGVNVLLPGGFLRRDSISLVGIDAHEEILKDYNLQKAFFSAKGLSLENGLTDVNQLEVGAKRAFLRRARHIIAVMDGSKWAQVSFISFASLDQIHTVITDSSAPSAMISKLRERGVEVVVV